MSFFTSLPMLAKAYVLATLTVCPPPESVPRVDVFLIPSKPVYVTEAPTAALEQSLKKSGKANHATLEAGTQRILALTEVSMQGGKYHSSFDGLTDNEGNKCTYIESMKMVMRYKPTIYIGSDIKADACLYSAARKSEEKYITEDIKIMQKHINRIKMSIMMQLRVTEQKGPFKQNEAEKHRDALVQEVMKAVRPLEQKMYDERQAQLSRYDTVDCSGAMETP